MALARAGPPRWMRQRSARLVVDGPGWVVIVVSGGQPGGLAHRRTRVPVGAWAPWAGPERQIRPGSAARAGSASQPARTSASNPAPGSSWRAAASGCPRTSGTTRPGP